MAIAPRRPNTSTLGALDARTLNVASITAKVELPKSSMSRKLSGVVTGIRSPPKGPVPRTVRTASVMPPKAETRRAGPSRLVISWMP